MAKNTNQLLSGAAALLLLVSLILVAIYGAASCSSGYVNLNLDCISQTPAFCSYGPAFTTNILNPNLTNGSHENGSFITCPWRTATSVFSYVGIGASLLFLVILNVSGEVKRNVVFAGLGGSVILLIGIVLMIIDIILGSRASSAGWHNTSQGPFIATVVLASFGLFIVGYSVLASKKASSSVDNPSRNLPYQANTGYVAPPSYPAYNPYQPSTAPAQNAGNNPSNVPVYNVGNSQAPLSVSNSDNSAGNNAPVFTAS